MFLLQVKFAIFDTNNIYYLNFYGTSIHFERFMLHTILSFN